MARFTTPRWGGWLVLLAALSAGCLGLRREPRVADIPIAAVPRPVNVVSAPQPSAQASHIVPASAQEPAAGNATTPTKPLGAGGELSADHLVQEVLARNPSLAQMVAAWQAASARYPQAVSLEDPMFGATFGPGTIGSSNVNFAWRVEASQKYPWPGKRGLRGQNALAEAAAAGGDVDDMRLQLIESARSAFYDYDLVYRAIDINNENLRLLADLRQLAEDRFKALQAPQQDVLQAEVEIGRQRERGLTLERMRKVAIARINTLMHLPPDSLLPPPPKELTAPASPPPVEELRNYAVAQRPDLQALRNRVAAEEAALALAQREHCPDIELMAAYDKFMGNQMGEMAPMVGVRLNVPTRRARRHAAVAEAMSRVAQRQAEFDARLDQVNLQVQEAYEQLGESEKALRLYEETILPKARQTVDAARQAYAANRVPFISLIEAQRNWVMLRDKFYEVQADYFRRAATLERVTGSSLRPPAPASPPQPPRASGGTATP